MSGDDDQHDPRGDPGGPNGHFDAPSGGHPGQASTLSGQPAPLQPAATGTTAAPDTGPRRRGFIDDVAAELAGLRRGVREAVELGRANDGHIAELRPALGELQEELAELTGRVSTLSSATDEDDTAGPDEAVLAGYGLGREPRSPVCWALLDPEQTRAAWQALAAWLGRVVTVWHRPTRGQLPDCWALHPPAVAALSWAWETYRAAHVGAAFPAARAEWSTRWWPGTLEVLAQVIDPALCSPGWHLMDERDRADARAEDRARRQAQHPDRPESAGQRRETDAELEARARRTRLRESRTGAARPRRLAATPGHMLDNSGSDGYGAGLAARASHPWHWLACYRDAAAEDLTARRQAAHGGAVDPVDPGDDPQDYALPEPGQ